ncbi:hypothetical protein K0M31_009797 [Melipona bicolor]|uniref:Uncharacterized protein n=1 Tax=Melipona bicolor TaxID=60889 RepID=A0AA40FN80_9HYME|nr:hypothetical protein K0M31_009797 [Melipona bicolor]
MTADSLFETTSIPGHLAPTPQRLERLLSKQTLEELYEVEEQPFARDLCSRQSGSSVVRRSPRMQSNSCLVNHLMHSGDAFFCRCPADGVQCFRAKDGRFIAARQGIRTVG